MDRIKNDWKKWTYYFLLGVAIIVVYHIFNNFNDVMGVLGGFFDIIAPFLVGIFIAYLLYMPCRKFESFYYKSKSKFIKKKSRALGIITVYLIAFLIIAVMIGVILPVVIESVTDLLNNIQHYYEMTIDRYNALPEDSLLKSDIVNDAIQNIQNVDIKQYFQVDKILEYVVTAVQAITGIVDVFVALIVSVYILAERTKIIAFLKKIVAAMFKERTYKNIDKYFNNSNEIFFKFIASQFLDAVIVGTLITIALTIMGVRYAPLLGFFIGLFNMIPYVGAIIATAIAAIITLITGGLSQAIWMLIVTIILQQIDANIINPKIVGQSLKISPLLVLFAVTVGGAYFGILGMFLAVPVIAVIRILVDDYLDFRIAIKKKQKMDEKKKKIEKIENI